jgi:glycosyltransferase involved in cell wall biosynthesis
MDKMNLFIVVNVDWFFLSHRLPIALEAIKSGYKVTVFTIDTGRVSEIESYGLRCIKLPTSRSGTNVFKELKVILLLLYYYIKEKPQVVHHVSLKPITYGSIVAKIVKTPKVINAFSGLGYLFINKEKNLISFLILTKILRFVFKNNKLEYIIQNEDDKNILHSYFNIDLSKIYLIKGSGIDLTFFQYTAPVKKPTVQIVLPSRMLWDKGVGEFVEASLILSKKYLNNIEFILCGGLDYGNKSSIHKDQLLNWQKNSSIKWLDHQDDIKKIIIDSDIIVLPSYREGLPKVLIEACGIGRPIVTTDVPGCRDVVTEGINGFLVPPKNSVLLSLAIEKLILNEDLRIKMGYHARLLAEKEFCVNDVIQKTLFMYKN